MRYTTWTQKSLVVGGGVSSSVVEVKQTQSRFYLPQEALKNQITNDPKIHLCLISTCEKNVCFDKLLHTHVLFCHLCVEGGGSDTLIRICM